MEKYAKEAPKAAPSAGIGLSLAESIEQGRKDQLADAVRKRLEAVPPLEIIDNEFIPALDRVGKRFEAGEIFLPRLMQSAQTVQNGFAIIKDRMRASGEKREAKAKSSWLPYMETSIISERISLT